MTVRDIIKEELEAWHEEPQDNLLEIYKGDKKLRGVWVEDSEEELKDYMNMEVDTVNYYSEQTEIYLKEI